MKKVKVNIAVLLVLVFTLAVFGTAFKYEPVKGNTIVESTFADPMGLCDGWETDQMTSDISFLLNDSLLDVDANFNLYNKMADSYTVSKDGLTYTVKLKTGWKFHDGSEVTADDVAYSFNLILNPDANSPRMGDLDPLKSVEATDKYTAVFHLKTKDVYFALGKLTLAYIYPKKYLSKYAPKDVRGSDFMKHPIGCGPMKFVEYLPGERLVFEKFNDYYAQFKPKTPCDQYIFQINPSQPTAILRAMNGDANVVSVPANEIAATKGNANLVVKAYPSTSYMYLEWNLKRPFFSDIRVRQALTMGVNKAAIAKGIYKGYYTPASAWFPPVFPYYNPKVKVYNYDIAAAKKLLDDAGWKVGKDGIRAKDGVKFHFVLITNKGNVNREKSCVFIQSCYKQIGVDVEVRALEWNTLNKKYLETKNFDAAYIGLVHGSVPDIKSVLCPGGYFNEGSYNNAEINKLADQLPLTDEVNAQYDILKRAQEIVANELPFSVMLFATNTYANAKNVKDFDYKWFGRWHPSDWHVAN
jgi:peptide/nickel transport system substrate-binding protein